MRIIKRIPYTPDAPNIALLTAFMQTRTEATFNEIRAGIPQFATFTDGQIHQVAQDAEFDVEI